MYVDERGSKDTNHDRRQEKQVFFRVKKLMN